MGTAISNINTYVAAGLESASLALSLSSFLDPSGSLLKLSQMVKIYCRFRFFNINFGGLLGSYFDFSAEKFDPPSSKPHDYILKHSNKFYGNLFSKKVALSVFEVNLLRMLIFGVSWLLKIIANLSLIVMRKNGRVIKGLAHFISISQKAHMIALNAVAIDLIPYTLITILHTRELPLLVTWSSFAFLALLVFDYCEIWAKGGSAKIKEYKEGPVLD